MKKIPYKIRILIAILCFATALQGLIALGYLYSISAPNGALAGTLVTAIVCAVAGVIFLPTHKPDGTPIINEKKPKPKAKPRPTVYNKPIKTHYEKPQEEEDEEEEEEDEILAMEMLDDVLDD
jgi:hypothetical protein